MLNGLFESGGDAGLQAPRLSHVNYRACHCPLAAGRGAKFDSGLTVAQGGCVEPRYCPSLETKFK